MECCILWWVRKFYSYPLQTMTGAFIQFFGRSGLGDRATKQGNCDNMSKVHIRNKFYRAWLAGPSCFIIYRQVAWKGKKGFWSIQTALSINIWMRHTMLWFIYSSSLKCTQSLWHGKSARGDRGPRLQSGLRLLNSVQIPVNYKTESKKT